MHFEARYVSSNCNPVPTVADWGKNNVICYASCNSIFIYEVDFGSGGKITKSLAGHSGRVNSVKWLRGKDVEKETEIVSGSADGTAIVWTLQEDEYIGYTLEGHKSNINIVDGLYKDENKTNAYIVTASMDCSIKIWFRSKTAQFELFQNISYDYNIAVGLRLAYFYENYLILACALDNSKIQLFIQNSENVFEKSVLICGHEDWVRGLDFVFDSTEELLLASCSQDSFIRLWRITPQNIPDDLTEEHFVENSKFMIQTNIRQYRICLESLLTGHEGWIYSVNWSSSGLQLLSASLDKTMIIWEYDSVVNLWLEKVRVGEIGGNTLGFYGCLFGPNNNKILAYNYQGAFHIWNKDEMGQWEPQVTVGGHFSEVTDLAWEPNGEFLISVSADQTTRVHAPWLKDDKQVSTWHEIARPQVHGYDLSSLAILSRYRFVSGAEEKIVRVFEAPRTFVENFRRICGVQRDEHGDFIINTNQFTPKGASVPSLGLSNKAVYSDDNIEDASAFDKKNPYPEESHFVAKVLTEPPTEETLLQNTLWPEVQKLYGHGYEVISLAASPDGKLVASACKSSKPEHAAILLWDVQNWQQIQKLMSHTLTVVQMQFSPDGNYLLSVSRDRRWSIFSKNKETGAFELEATTDKKTSVHTRIIWSCSWSNNSQYFATGSRDGKVIVWWKNLKKEADSSIGQYEPASEHLEMKNDAVTAVAFAPQIIRDDYLIAIGLESGFIYICKWNKQGWNKVLVLNKSVAHHLTVKRLAFRPLHCEIDKKENVLQLASCSSDCSVRLYDIYLD